MELDVLRVRKWTSSRNEANMAQIHDRSTGGKMRTIKDDCQSASELA